MNKEELLKKIAELETMNDQLITELRYLDELLREAGFEHGIASLKSAAEELIEEDRNEQME